MLYAEKVNCYAIVIHVHVYTFFQLLCQPTFQISMISGSPTPKVEWFIDEDLIPSDDDYYEMSFVGGRATLHMRTVDVHDEGEYLLVATNNFGSASTSCELTIAGKIII